MTHNFVIYYKISDWENAFVFNGTFEVQAKCLDDALIALYEFNELAEYIKHDIDINPAAYESESDTIGIYLDSSKK